MKHHKEKPQPGKKLSNGLEALMKEFLEKLAESAYLVALKTGFRGSFIMFLTDLQEALEQVIEKDKEWSRRHPDQCRGARVAAVIH